MTTKPADETRGCREFRIEYHRVWVRTVEAESRKEARQIVEADMSEEPDAEDYSYSIVKQRYVDRDDGGEGHNAVWGA